MSLAKAIAKDMTLLTQFTDFLKTYKHPAIIPDVVLAMPDIVAMGVYMDFFEQEYGISVTADNASYTIYKVPVSEESKHRNALIEHMRKHGKNIIVDEHTLPNVDTVMHRYIDGIKKMIQITIMPF